MFVIVCPWGRLFVHTFTQACDCPPQGWALCAYVYARGRAACLTRPEGGKLLCSFVTESKLIKDLDSFDSFCDKVKPLAKRNELYNGFSREANIALAQLRMQCSNLNGHLYNLHVMDSPKCSCSYKCEDSNHYLFHCPLYTTERCNMLDTVNEICSGNVDLNLLLHGG